jgi:putative membrane protein
MLIDYLTLLLVNMAAGLVLLAWYIFRGLEGADQKRWIAPFAIVGLIAATAGFAMTFTWPLPGSYNIPYGELSVFIGFLFLGAALSLALGSRLIPVGLYAFFPGLAAVLVGVRFIGLGLSEQPLLAGVGFILTGLGGVFALPTLYWRNNKGLRVIGALVLLGAAAIWGVTGYGAYWNHLTEFATWVPATAL